jgi:antitoxin component YwqK of YwqJK toxin-antitoxin module
MNNLTTTQQNRLQEAARNYFSDRTEKNFNALYKLCKPIIEKASKAILKDKDLVSNNVSEVMIKIFENTSFTFDENKSFYSWLYNSARNQAILFYNKNRKTISSETLEDGLQKNKVRRIVFESELQSDQEEQIENILDYFSSKHIEHEEEEVKYIKEEEIVGKVIDIIENKITKTKEDAKLLIDRLIGNISPEKLKDEYGIKSRITVTSRRRRAIQKINEILTPEVNFAKFKDKALKTGDVVQKFDNGNIEAKFSVKNGLINGEAINYYENGNVKCKINYKNGVKHGSFSKYNIDGFIELDGFYKNGEKCGVWKRYENGLVIEEYHQESSYYVLFDEKGKKIDEGFIIKDCNCQEIKKYYDNGKLKMVGLMKDGKMSGICKRYHENGRLDEVINYETGLYKVYNEKGKLELQGYLQR